MSGKVAETTGDARRRRQGFESTIDWGQVKEPKSSRQKLA